MVPPLCFIGEAIDTCNHIANNQQPSSRSIQAQQQRDQTTTQVEALPARRRSAAPHQDLFQPNLGKPLIILVKSSADGTCHLRIWIESPSVKVGKDVRRHPSLVIMVVQVTPIRTIPLNAYPTMTPWNMTRMVQREADATRTSCNSTTLLTTAGDRDPSGRIIAWMMLRRHEEDAQAQSSSKAKGADSAQYRIEQPRPGSALGRRADNNLGIHQYHHAAPV